MKRVVNHLGDLHVFIYSAHLKHTCCESGQRTDSTNLIVAEKRSGLVYFMFQVKPDHSSGTRSTQWPQITPLAPDHSGALLVFVFFFHQKHTLVVNRVNAPILRHLKCIYLL